MIVHLLSIKHIYYQIFFGVDYFVLNLKTVKEAFGYTYEDLMRLFDVQSRTTILNYLTGTSAPARKKCEDFADEIGVSYDELTGKELTYAEAKALASRKQYGKNGTESDRLLTDEGDGGYQYKSKKHEEHFDVTLAVHTGRIIADILDKHRTPREYYAREILKRDSRTLQRICKGEIMAGFDIILRVAIDHNEPLELFRTGPLPQGHLLSQLRDKETIIDTQRQLITALQQRA